MHLNFMIKLKTYFLCYTHKHYSTLVLNFSCKKPSPNLKKKILYGKNAIGHINVMSKFKFIHFCLSL